MCHFLLFQRMLERAKARREKLEAKLPPSEQNKHKRQPLMESNQSPNGKPSKSPRTSASSVTKVEKNYSVMNGSEFICGNDENDVAVKINIVHQNNVQVEVQVEEREVTLSEYLKEKENDSAMVEIRNIENKNNGDCSFKCIILIILDNVLIISYFRCCFNHGFEKIN